MNRKAIAALRVGFRFAGLRHRPSFLTPQIFRTKKRLPARVRLSMLEKLHTNELTRTLQTETLTMPRAIMHAESVNTRLQIIHPQTPRFGKSEACPSTGDLLKFLHETESCIKRACTARHLASCDFCNAELDFLRHYPPTELFNENECESGEPIPFHLYALAHATFGKRQAK